ncbi:MAG: Gfo/Idh/MocA family oxidoreductase [Verrucomicrobiota bacterium]|nr:Gfo/Idh/MocA family oxidoreductase [Verrucomicrobiota bacterium]
MNHRTSRRTFIRKTSATAAILGFPSITHSKSPNSKLNVGLIGVGGRGRSHVNACKGEHIVALCDVNSNSLKGALTVAPEARTYGDLRDFVGHMDDLDAVVVSTTEHTHAFATLPALQAGKHVYCEKPLTRDVHECRIITEAAAKADVQTQMGTQIHAGENYRRVVELIQSGAIGPVSEVHTWVSRAWGWQSDADAKRNRDILSTQDTPTESQTPPEILDWDLWIGPAPHRPFHSDYFPGPRWYRWWDFGNGTMSDLGSHRNDLPWWALKLDVPRTIEPLSGPRPHHDIAPASMSVKYTFAARGDGYPAVEHTWYQGSEKPKIWHDGGIPKWGSGSLFIGADGMLLADYGKHLLLPEKAFKGFEYPERSIEPSPGQQAEWIRACKGEGPRALCHFAYAGPLTEANHLGNVAYRAGKKLEWDASNMRIPNLPDAEKYLGRSYRKGWKLG